MNRYSELPERIRLQLALIEPSRDRDRDFSYYPVRTVLKSGEIHDNVYISAEEAYRQRWPLRPEESRDQRCIRIDDVKEIEDSPTRLPARFANGIYRHGESGMGYTIFTVVFRDGERQECVTSNAVDFIRYPSGKGPKDVASVIPHERRAADNLVKSPGCYWCLYSEPAATS